ncbi:MAG TPA: hypothetical protein VN455_05485, partial [Methanotrichaceae archaeon]|nr:hypothetical protein [Methanotrichaceae archaeon]
MDLGREDDKTMEAPYGDYWAGNSPDKDLLAPEERSKRTHLERFISLIPVQYYWGWFLIAVAFLSLSY